MRVNESYLWTDLAIVLTWIQGPPNKWKNFVGNRDALIQEETESATRRHVSSQSNPADLFSRRVEATTLLTSTTMVEMSTMDYTGVIQLAHNRGQHSHKQFGN